MLTTINFNTGVGGFAETAFFHKDTKTLLVTDTIIRVDNEPPAIIQDDPRSLIYHSRNKMPDIVDDTPENRRKGWRRMVLFGLFFRPAGNFIDCLCFSSARINKILRTTKHYFFEF